MKKKILITGMNTLQVTEDFYKRQQLQVIPSHTSLIACLRDMGYEVIQRPVDIGEKLDEFHKVIVYIHNPSGFAGFVYNALWAIYARPDCVMAFDDWQTDSIYSGITSLKDPAKLFREYVRDSHKNIPENIESYESEFIEAIQRIESKRNKMLISAFSGGDLGLLLDHPNLYRYNPNPYHIHRQAALFFGDKERVFNFAGLVQDKTKKWLKAQQVEKTGWGLKLYGSRKDGQDRVTEDEMVNIYAQQWGILMPGYFHAGSGWWRARFCQCADAGSILIGEPKEMMVVYKNKDAASIKASELPNMSDKHLEDFAAFQKECLYKAHPLDKAVQQAELSEVLK
jgi:hypothetical protein